MSRAFECDFCQKFFIGVAPYKIQVTNVYTDPRDGNPNTYGHLCSSCVKELLEKLKEKK